MRTMRSIRLQRKVRKTGIVLHDADYPGNAIIEVKRVKLKVDDDLDTREIVHVTISVPANQEQITNEQRKRRTPVHR